MKKLLSVATLSAFAFIAGSALADEAMRLNDTQMDNVVAGDTRVTVDRNVVNLQRDFATNTTAVDVRESTISTLNTAGGVVSSRSYTRD